MAELSEVRGKRIGSRCNFDDANTRSANARAHAVSGAVRLAPEHVRARRHLHCTLVQAARLCVPVVENLTLHITCRPAESP